MDGELSTSTRDHPIEPRFFATQHDLREWFEAHHATDPELLVGFHKVGSGVIKQLRPSG